MFLHLQDQENAGPMMNKKDGFTITEFIFSSLLTVMMLIVVIAILFTAKVNFQFADIKSTLQSGARLAIRKTVNDLRLSDPSRVTVTRNSPVSGSDKVDYSILPDADNDGIPDMNGSEEPDLANAINRSISLESASKRLIQIEGVKTTVLADNVKSVNFVNHQIAPALYLEEIQIILQLEKKDASGRAHNVAVTAVLNVRN